jgi:hypothetical protein
MDTLSSILEFLSSKELSVPLGQVILFVLVNSLCLLYGRYKLGLLVSYCFVLYWGFIFNFKYFTDLLGNTTFGMPIYVFSGVVMLVLVVIGFFVGDKD